MVALHFCKPGHMILEGPKQLEEMYAGLFVPSGI